MPTTGKVYNFTEKASISDPQTWKTSLKTATKSRPRNYQFRTEPSFIKANNHSKSIENLKSICQCGQLAQCFQFSHICDCACVCDCVHLCVCACQCVSL